MNREDTLNEKINILKAEIDDLRSHIRSLHENSLNHHYTIAEMRKILSILQDWHTTRTGIDTSEI